MFLFQCPVFAATLMISSLPTVKSLRGQFSATKSIHSPRVLQLWSDTTTTEDGVQNLYSPVESEKNDVMPSHSPQAGAPVFYDEPSSSSTEKDSKRFEKECLKCLLSAAVTDDELISQHEFANFLTKYCHWDGVCQMDEILHFDMLPSPIQSAFVSPLCPDSNSNSANEGIWCIDETKNDFGYVYNDETKKQAKKQISDLCASLYPLVGEFVKGTMAPSSFPIKVSPTNSPVHPPVFSPTEESPTTSEKADKKSGNKNPPVCSKTNAPVVSPVYFTKHPRTSAPVFSPVYYVKPPKGDSPKTSKTSAPVFSPIFPTDVPSNSPFVSPSPTEYLVETSQPSMKTLAPTHILSLSPSDSAQPSLASIKPTFTPSMTPIGTLPSKTPTGTPTGTPSSLEGTAAPIDSPIVNLQPTMAPSEFSTSFPVVFINEIGSINTTRFVEIAYSGIIGMEITKYTYHLYNSNGTVLASRNFSEGLNSVSGMVFTYDLYPDTKISKAVALVNPNGVVLYFFSQDAVVTAIDGPAVNLTSIDILQLMAESDTRESYNETLTRRALDTYSKIEDTSLGLTGVGCELEQFTFSKQRPTPGQINSEQIMRGCADTLAPSSTPAGVSQELSGRRLTGIIALSVIGAIFVLLVVRVVVGKPKQKKGSKKNNEIPPTTKVQEVLSKPSDEEQEFKQERKKARKTKIVFDLDELILAENQDMNATYSIGEEDYLIDTGDTMHVEDVTKSPISKNKLDDLELVDISDSQNVMNTVTPDIPSRIRINEASEHNASSVVDDNIVSPVMSEILTTPTPAYTPTFTEDDEISKPSVARSTGHSIGSGFMPIMKDLNNLTPRAGEVREFDGEKEVQSVTPSVAISIGTGSMPDASSIAVSLAAGEFPENEDGSDNYASTPRSVGRSVAYSIASGIMPTINDSSDSAPSAVVSVGFDGEDEPDANRQETQSIVPSVSPSIALSIGKGIMPQTRNTGFSLAAGAFTDVDEGEEQPISLSSNPIDLPQDLQQKFLESSNIVRNLETSEGMMSQLEDERKPQAVQSTTPSASYSVDQGVSNDLIAELTSPGESVTAREFLPVERNINDETQSQTRSVGISVGSANRSNRSNVARSIGIGEIPQDDAEDESL